MRQIANPLNEKTQEYFHQTKEKILLSCGGWKSAINTFSDDNGLIALTMDNSQIIHSMRISDKLFDGYEKNEIQEHIIHLINKSIIRAGENAVKEMQKAISEKEFTKILSNERELVKEQIEVLLKKNDCSVQQLSLKKKTHYSSSGKIIITISGNKLVQAITIMGDLLKKEKKDILEREIIETINEANQKIMEELQEAIKINEEEVYNVLLKK
ncbi:MAG: YbaB/EbfC family nucleoid-associated protein [Anaerolineales bacterium]|nr:YbaB/EbfC family nucleoid-associated protein [Anaerolineales bacterium]